jgi:hypothetical protein
MFAHESYIDITYLVFATKSAVRLPAIALSSTLRQIDLQYITHN